VSHFLQPLDLTLFSAFKRTYMNTTLIATRPKSKGKIVRALRAWYTSAHIGLIYNGWKAGRLQVRGPPSDDTISQLNSKKITQFICENCPDGTVITDDDEEEE
jgi:hypothetical protein